MSILDFESQMWNERKHEVGNTCIFGIHLNVLYCVCSCLPGNSSRPQMLAMLHNATQVAYQPSKKLSSDSEWKKNIVLNCFVFRTIIEKWNDAMLNMNKVNKIWSKTTVWQNLQEFCLQKVKECVQQNHLYGLHPVPIHTSVVGFAQAPRRAVLVEIRTHDPSILSPNPCH
jgi:hypothetical protein